MTFLRVLLLGSLGPALALIVTWHSAVRIANISAGTDPAVDIVERLRAVPGDSLLREMREVAVSYPRFYRMPTDQVLRMAEEMLHGEYSPDGSDVRIGVPFEPGRYLFGHSTWQLDLQSFLVPSVLGRAYEISGKSEYLEAAAQYILDWARYEAGLLIPRGLFFNDHALAARSIVVTEIWRLYRQSKAYRLKVAIGMLGYVQKLSRLLLEGRLYEYRTNHGLMQSLSLLHLGIAFPLLDVSKEDIRIGKRRLASQLNYHVNEEGVILEHSPGYHQNGLRRLAAAARYLGVLGDPVSESFAARYRKALDFLSALRRPDRTLPPIGDTDDRPLSPIQVTSFNHHVASVPLHDEPREMLAPSAVTAAPGAGWVILWDGLSEWPESSRLTQTVFHWANFPTGVHKHADDLGVSLWSHGRQWVRSIGHWPYNATRDEAIGWRSANGPHWLNESPASERVSSLVGSAVDDELEFFDVLRTNADGSHIRRQLVKLGSEHWIVLDSFTSHTPRVGEIVWRFPPGIVLEKSDPNGVVLESAGTHRKMSFHVGGSGPVKIETDPSGIADWNSGIVVSGKITSSPAIRLTSSTQDPVIVTFLGFRAATEPTIAEETIKVNWQSAAVWEVSVSSGRGRAILVKRDSDEIEVSRREAMSTKKRISTSLAELAHAPRDAALVALDRASKDYGIPFQAMTERRLKVTFVVASIAIGQLLVFFFVNRAQKRWWPPLAILSSIAWIGLSLYLGLIYLV